MAEVHPFASMVMSPIASTPPVRRIFVVLDPKQLVQAALEKAEWIAGANGAALDLYCAVQAEPWENDTDRIAARTRHWVERLAEAPRRAGTEVSVNVELTEDWRSAVADAAAASSADLIIKTLSRGNGLRRRMTPRADWKLLRHCPVPMLLVNPGGGETPKKVLAAVKRIPGDDVHTELNRRVIDLAHRIAALLGAELHAVTAYRGDDIFFDRQKFADGCRLPRHRVHAVEGPSYEGIAEVAERIDAGVVIVGCAPQPVGISILGTTAERVIDGVDGDIVVLPAA